MRSLSRDAAGFWCGRWPWCSTAICASSASRLATRASSDNARPPVDGEPGFQLGVYAVAAQHLSVVVDGNRAASSSASLRLRECLKPWGNRADRSFQVLADDQDRDRAMGQDLVCFAAQNDSRHSASAMGRHANEFAFLFSCDGDDLPVDIVALDKCAIQLDAGGSCKLLDCREKLLGFGLVLLSVRFGV